jgi:hypothetical protein
LYRRKSFEIMAAACVHSFRGLTVCGKGEVA